MLLDVSSKPFMKVELVLRLFYMLGEVITDKVGKKDHFCCITYMAIAIDSTTSCLHCTGVILILITVSS